MEAGDVGDSHELLNSESITGEALLVGVAGYAEAVIHCLLCNPAEVDATEDVLSQFGGGFLCGHVSTVCGHMTACQLFNDTDVIRFELACIALTTYCGRYGNR